MNINKSIELFDKAKKLFPGGVNSPVRAFRSVGGTPIFIEEGKGCKVKDVDGNEYIDFCCSWGPLILGHAHPSVVNKLTQTLSKGTSFGTPTKLENELGSLIIENHRFIEKIRFVSSGTEAVMSAIRLARGVTKRNKIIKFEGCYHGHVDSLLVKAGSGLATFGTSSSAGVPESLANETIVIPLNDTETLDKVIESHKNEIAGVIIEPIPANNGLLLQDKAFLKYLKEVCVKEGILLIFDEVISGFRVGFEGAAGLYNIQPDIITFGKVIGGGLPVGAYAASDEIMSNISPDGNVYQAGTLSGNPMAMAAGLAQLNECIKPGFYEEMELKTKKFVDQILAHTKANGYAFNIQYIGSIYWLVFDDKRITKSSQIQGEGMTKFSVLFHELLKRGIYIAPSGYEVGFISAAHSEAHLTKAAKAFCEGLDVVFG